MKKTILTFGASNSKQSINKQLAKYTAKQIQNVDIKLLDLNDFEMPIYSIDREKEGIPEAAMLFKKEIDTCNAIIISFAEHNGSYTAAFKNTYDWVSRIEKDVWQQKPMFLLSTSPGDLGAKIVLKTASNTFRYSNKKTISEFSLPSFNENFNVEKGILNKALLKEYKTQLNLFTQALSL